jgi:hypothetical protein
MRWIVWLAVIGCGDPCEPSRIASAPATHVAIDASDIYWTEAGDLLSRAKRGGNSSVLAPLVGNVGGMAALDGTVYWSGDRIDDQGAVVETGVFSSSTAGTVRLAGLSPCDAYAGVALDGELVFAASFTCDGSPAELVAVPRTGGPEVRTVLASDAFRIVAGDGGAQMVIGDELISISGTDGSSTTLARVIDSEVLGRDASTIFVSGGRQVLAVPAIGGVPSPVASLAQRPTAVAADATHVYVIAGGLVGPGELLVIPRGGDEPQPLVDSGNAAALTSDDDTVYWASSADPVGVWRVNKCAAD